MSTRELEFLAAGLSPKPDLADCVRRLPPMSASPLEPLTLLPAPAQEDSSPPRPDAGVRPAALLARPKIRPLSEDRVRIAFTAGRDVLDMIDRAKELLRHRYPDGCLEGIVADALRALLQRIDPEKRLQAKRSRKARPVCDPRRVPQTVRDTVWRRDGGRCTFLGPGGSRCPAHSALEFDHVKPFALGGRSDDPANIRLRCRAHNAWEARRVFGDAAIDAAVARRRRG